MKKIESNWLAQHPEIDQQYRGEYIAISGQRVIAHGKNLKEVMSEAQKTDPNPLISKIPSEEFSKNITSSIHQHLLESVKQMILQAEPEAQVILFGSRVRGDAEAESDWDFLVILPGPVDENRKDAIRHRLYELEWETGHVLSALIVSQNDWDSNLYSALPIYKEIEMEGRLL